MDHQTAIACSLTAGEQAGRRERWQRLTERAMIARQPTAAGVRLRFRPLDGVEAELDQLAALERECCSFAAWSASRHEGELVLDVTAAGEGVAAVRALFDQPSAVLPGTPTREDAR